ncbi:oligoendopeptidase F [Jeotgalibacillus soli]|uniref:Oligoendopeptidase F n=1 Tax=Jeotgalibacillus soli TaxID=889306 RepID=A0A0C2RUK9_9BACL|nr:oligoendopeptidase F [Jeotgalibacillus soli]
MFIRVVHVSTYSSLNLSGDGTNTDHQANASRVGSVIAEINGKLSFIHTELSALSNGQLEELLQSHELLTSFWGDTVEIDESASLTWVRQHHYYMGLYLTPIAQD